MRVYCIQMSSCDGIPEPNAAICSATTRSQQVGLEGTPGQGFDSSLMSCKPMHGPWVVPGPDVQQVVIAAAGKLLPTGRPGQPTDLLFVTTQSADDMLSRPADLADD